MTRPRILRIITRLNVGGPARQALFLTRALEEHGFSCELVSGTEGSREGRLEAVVERHTVVPSLRRPVSPAADLRAARTLQRIVRRRAPQVVHTHMAKAGALGRLAARRSGTPAIVHTFHGHVLDGYFPRGVARAFVLAERRLARWTDALVAVSPAIRDELLSLRIGRPSQWKVMPLGLELDDLLASPPDARDAREQLGLPVDGPVVGIVGRLTPIKDHQTFLEAAARIARSRPEVTFAVAGEGELREALEARGSALLGSHIRFLGWVTDLPVLYAALDVVALTSRNEGTPASLIEAAAASKPVVATRVGGVADVVQDGKTGILVPDRDPSALEAAVLRLLSDRATAAAMGNTAREWVRERFSADRLADDISALYEELLARRGIVRR